jgi:hypothetical protein
VVEKLLSLITFFAAAKKVIPPPGRRLLNKKAKIQQPKPQRKSPLQAHKPSNTIKAHQNHKFKKERKKEKNQANRGRAESNNGRTC